METITILEFLGTKGQKSNFMIMDEKGRVRKVVFLGILQGMPFTKK